MKAKLISAVLGCLMLASTLNSVATGTLIITNNILGANTPRVVLRHNSSGTDGYDGGTIDANKNPDPSPGFSDIYAVIPGYELAVDTRADSSTNSFVLKSVFNGTLTQPTDYKLKIGFGGTNQFQHKLHLTLREITNGVPTENKWDLKDIIANHGGIVPLGSIPPGTYDINTPVRSFQIDFQPVIDNSPPVASNQTNVVLAELPSPLSLYGFDADVGDALHFAIVTGPANGTLLNMVSNQVTYQSVMNYYGSDSFVYSVDDGLATNQGTVSLNVTPLNRQPFFTGATASEGQMNLNAMVQPNRELRLMAADSLENSWQALQTQAIAWSTNLLVPYTNSFPATNTLRLFRLQSVVP